MTDARDSLGPQGPGLYRTLGIEIVERSPARVVATMPFSDAAQQPTGVFHAGAILGLADTAASMLCAAIAMPEGFDPTKFPLAVQISINLVRNTNRGSLRAEATPKHVGRSLIVVETTVTTDEGKLCATVTSTHFRPDSRGG